MSDLSNIDVIRALLARHGLRAQKGLGQNFLCDAEITRQIADSAGIDRETCVLEVGPGLGTLTRELCARAKTVATVELDRALPAVLRETMAGCDNFRLIAGDILKTDIRALAAEHFGDARAVACANLPYYITTPALTALIDARCFARVTVMVQKEVACRMCAAPATSDYGALTLYIAYHADARIITEVPRACFVPAPHVDSAVVSLDMRSPTIAVRDESLFFRVVRASFALRRKTLTNSLSHAFHGQLDKQTAAECLSDCGIHPSARGETLSLAQFGALADRLADEFGVRRTDTAAERPNA